MGVGMGCSGVNWRKRGHGVSTAERRSAHPHHHQINAVRCTKALFLHLGMVKQWCQVHQRAYLHLGPKKLTK